MKSKVILFLGLALNLLACTVSGAQLDQTQSLVYPAVIERPATQEEIRIWNEPAAGPRSLRDYLNRDAQRKLIALGPRVGPLEDLQAASQFLLREYFVVTRLGDIGGPDAVPALERYVSEREADREFDAATKARLAIERIRSRQEGKNAYVTEMIRWVQWPDAAPNASVQQQKDQLRRVIEGARALGVMKASEGVPAIIARRDQPEWDNTHFGFFLVRALARIGDPRALKTLHDQLGNFADYVPSAQLPLEPGEPDVAWAYWQMRTQGMNMGETINDMIRSMVNDPAPLRAYSMLELIGKPAVPALVSALKTPPSGRFPQTVTIGSAMALGNLRAVEAVPTLRDLVLNGTPVIRPFSAHALGQIGDRSAVPELMQAATNPDRMTQSAAIGALGALADARAEGVLLKLLESHPDPNVRYDAARALATSGTRSSSATLQKLLSTEQEANIRFEIGKTLDAIRSR